MLLSLSIENYALINKILINFNSGFSVITGETGAGKSIIMDAMGLVLGQRADTNVLLDKSKKCIIEATFDIAAYKLEAFFEEHDIDYEKTCIVVRQIAPNGKSRAFINDVPCQLSQLKILGHKLIDIHSQNSNKLLDSPEFQLYVVDSFVRSSALLEKYTAEFKILKKISKELQELQEQQSKDFEEKEYYNFLFEELDKLKLKQDEVSNLENEFEFLTHSEEIQQNLSAIFNLYSEGEMSVESQLKEAVQKAETIKHFFKPAEEFHQRLNSALIELNDIAKEIEITGNDIEYDPERLQFVKGRLDTIYNLMQKHKVKTGDELIEVYKDINERLMSYQSREEGLVELNQKKEAQLQTLNTLANELSRKRENGFKPIEKYINKTLNILGIPYANFTIEKVFLKELSIHGQEQVVFKFSANKNTPVDILSKVASGGELSRIMLSIKALLSEKVKLPTIIFDEVDTGVSGEIAEKMGSIMKQMSSNMQVLSITHLPQVAGIGDAHYLVYKKETTKSSSSNIKRLSTDERIVEIAKMLSGENISDAALQHARELLLISQK